MKSLKFWKHAKSWSLEDEIMKNITFNLGATYQIHWHVVAIVIIWHYLFFNTLSSAHNKICEGFHISLPKCFHQSK